MSASSSPRAPSSFAVLGAGITGLTAAHRLAQLGHHVRVFEQAPRTGGAIRSERTGDWLVEAGPNSLLGGEPALAGLLRELDLEGERLVANPAAKKRFIVRDGRPLVVPLSPPALLRSRLFSPAGKLRLFGDLFARRRERTADLSLAALIETHFGREAVAYGLEPMVSGIYAGDATRLSAKHAMPKLWAAERTHGSILRAQIAAARERRRHAAPRAALFSFRDGLQQLPDALAARLPSDALVLGARVETLVPGPPWSVVWQRGNVTQTETFDAVLCALPAGPLARLRVGALGERPLAVLDAIEQPPVASLFLGFKREQVAHPLDGFGLLVPPVERRSILGVLFSSTLFPRRAPDGCVALTVMIGGARQPEFARREPDALRAAVLPELAQLLGVSGDPVFVRHAFWPHAIPQYNLGYETHLDAMAACERAHPGLLIGGQARDGISVPACIAAGEKLATRATAHLPAVPASSGAT